MTTMIFMFVGLLLSLGAVVLAAVSDRSLLSADDIEHLFRLPVLAVVPAAATGRRGSVAERSPFTSVAAPPERGPAVVAADGANGANGAIATSTRKAQSRTPPRAPRSRRSTVGPTTESGS
jgi:hypothetical protein